MDNGINSKAIPITTKLSVPDGFDSNASRIYRYDYGNLTVITFTLLTNTAYSAWKETEIATTGVKTFSGNGFDQALCSYTTTQYPLIATYGSEGTIRIRNSCSANIPSNTYLIGELVVFTKK